MENTTLHRSDGDLYPTHGLGPVSPMLNINREIDCCIFINATQSRGLHNYIVNKGGINHPNAEVDFKCGDIVSTVIKCEQGQTIMLSHDTNNPRPYSLNFRVQGTSGIWQKDSRSIYIEGLSKNTDGIKKKNTSLNMIIPFGNVLKRTRLDQGMEGWIFLF